MQLIRYLIEWYKISWSLPFTSVLVIFWLLGINLTKNDPAMGIFLAILTSVCGLMVFWNLNHVNVNYFKGFWYIMRVVWVLIIIVTFVDAYIVYTGRLIRH